MIIGFLQVFGAIAGVVVVGIVSLGAAGWVMMIALGAASHIFDMPKLAVGFVPATVLAFLFGAIFGRR